jgi:hypothetical protein
MTVMGSLPRSSTPFQPGLNFRPLFKGATPQGLRQPLDFFTPSSNTLRFGVAPQQPTNANRFNALPIEWPADWNGHHRVVENFTITKPMVHELLKNAALEATIAVKQIPSHDSEDGFGSSAVVLHGNQSSTISAHNNKVPRLDEGPNVYCAERKILLNASGPKGEKGFIPLLVVVNDEAPFLPGISYSSCGPCLDEIRSAVLGTHPTARMSRDSLIAFVDTRIEKPRIVLRLAGEMLPIKAVTSYSTTPVWKLAFEVSDRAKQVPLYQASPWLFHQWVRLGVWKARRQAQRAETIGLQNDKGPSVGSVVLKKAWYGFKLFVGNNAYIKTRRYSAPFQNTLEALGRQQRTQIQGGILVSNKPKVNVINLEDIELLSYTAKEKENLFVITVNGHTVSIKTYPDYVPYPYHRAHHIKK